MNKNDKIDENLGQGLTRSADGKIRCGWHGGRHDYLLYHDEEWGKPQNDDNALFEKICLEGFQSGLSWLTILRKRDNFRNAFCGFDFEKIAAFTEKDVNRLVLDKGIIRHRGKIVSTVNNARKAIEMAESEGSLGGWFWRFEPPESERPKRLDYKTSLSPELALPGAALSKELKKRGWSFVGPTTCYAFMQAMGLVNDHLDGCWRREKIEAERKRFARPGADSAPVAKSGEKR